MNKILVIVGPTSSGKSELAVRLAKKFNGEIVSCDSRQVYSGMNLGTGKINGKWSSSHIDGRQYVRMYIYKNIPHHLIDFANPKKQYSVSLFQRDAKKIIADILKRGRLPILCGGTGHWIDAVVYDQQLPDVKPSAKLRQKLEKLSTERLFARICAQDPRRAKTIDKHNRRRLIRALEIIISTGKPVPPLSVIPSASEGSLNASNINKGFLAQMHSLGMTSYNYLWIGLNPSQPLLFAKIKKRLKQRIKAGLLNEVKKLHKQGVSYKRFMNFGLEYRFGALYLQKKITYDEMLNQMLLANQHYAKKQMTWWKRNKDIRWINKYRDAEKLVKNFKL
jgi:tRNA dimethylallyltransferase